MECCAGVFGIIGDPSYFEYTLYNPNPIDGSTKSFGGTTYDILMGRWGSVYRDLVEMGNACAIELMLPCEIGALPDSL